MSARVYNVVGNVAKIIPLTQLSVRIAATLVVSALKFPNGAAKFAIPFASIVLIEERMTMAFYHKPCYINMGSNLLSFGRRNEFTCCFGR